MFIFFNNKIIVFLILRFTLMFKTYVIFALEIFNKFFNFIIIHFHVLTILSNVCFLNNCIKIIKMRKNNKKVNNLN